MQNIVVACPDPARPSQGTLGSRRRHDCASQQDQVHGRRRNHVLLKERPPRDWGVAPFSPMGRLLWSSLLFSVEKKSVVL